MNLSGISNHGILGRTLRLPLRLVPPTAVMPILQGRLRGKRWIVGSSTHGCWLGSYEYQKRRLFERTVKPGQVVYDVGANAGFYTILASVLVGPAGKVVAFEPVLRNLDYLRRHIELNRLTNVTVVPDAVSDGDGQGCFREGPDPSVGSLAQDGALRVRTVSLDRLIEEGRIPASRRNQDGHRGRGVPRSAGGAHPSWEGHRPQALLGDSRSGRARPLPRTARLARLRAASLRWRGLGLMHRGHREAVRRLSAVVSGADVVGLRQGGTDAGMAGLPLRDEGEAVDCFLRTHMDALALGPFLAVKRGLG